MISVSDENAFVASLLGLRFPPRIARPSPKPTAAEGMPSARIRAAATA